MWIHDAFFKYSIAIILILLIFLLLYYTAPVFYPIMWFIAAILLPILFSTLIYYILRPIVSLVHGWGVPRYLSIVIVYFFIALLIFCFSFFLGGGLIEEVSHISNIPPEKIESLKLNTANLFEKLKGYLPESQIPTLESMSFSYLQKINTFLYQLLLNMITTITSITIALVLTPFVLFYFLRDDNLLSRSIIRFVPLEYKEEVEKIINDIDDTLSSFIVAQMTIALVVGFFLFCGYIAIGLPQALALALFAMVFYIIPILGTFIAIIPALIVALSISFMMAFKVILVMLLAHFIEANFLTPRLMSKHLNIHPLTIILLLLAAGSLYGLLGLLLVTPTYAIIKVIVWNLYKISRLRYAIAKTKAAALNVEGSQQAQGVDKT